MVQKIPTHHVRHVGGYEVAIDISSVLFNRLHSHAYLVRTDARSIVCQRAMDAINDKYSTHLEFKSLSKVEWCQITVTKLVPPPIPAAASVVAKAAEDSDDECDDCPMCDTGYHERCRSGNCPVTRRW